MNLPIDIELRICKDFPEQNMQELVKNIFEEMSIDEKDRVVRCILFLANGNLKRLRDFVELAKIDYRDVIMTGEYEYPSNKKLRDFNISFKTY